MFWADVGSCFGAPGLLTTTAAMVAGVLIYDSKLHSAGLTSFSRDFDSKNKHSFFKAWKFYTVLFQFALLLEMVIVPYFWSSLYVGCVVDGEQWDGPWPPKCYANVFDHSIPLICLAIDFVINVQPYIRRHMLLTTIFGCCYVFTNFLYTKISGTPVYPTMDWSSAAGIITPLMLLVAGPIIFLILEFVNSLKLRAAGHGKMVNLCRGRLN